MGFLYDMLFRGIFHLYLVSLVFYYSGWDANHQEDDNPHSTSWVEWTSRFNLCLIGGSGMTMIVLGIIFSNHRNRRAMCTMMAKPYSFMGVDVEAE
jgi:hypothetical protein